jgi:diaminohydroxyphosphoribosylaminopyrimidine deaminase/5-amino-6-(5-phosphoribosylamino)uracil reductase
MGLREVPAHARVRNAVAETVLLRTQDPKEALTELFARGGRHVLLEGGPRLAAAFLGQGYVDEVVAYIAPMLLGAGAASVGDLGVRTIADAHRLEVVDITVLGEGADRNVRLTLTVPREA